MSGFDPEQFDPEARVTGVELVGIVALVATVAFAFGCIVTSCAT